MVAQPHRAALETDRERMHRYVVLHVSQSDFLFGVQLSLYFPGGDAEFDVNERAGVDVVRE